ncbi:MAG: acetyltransferase [Thermodesulfobacteriota bacterium]
MDYDIFNGDADGICALHQLRLAEPRPDAELVTGVKRDIKLLSRLEGVSSSRLTVFDISMQSNLPHLENLLAADNSITYIDHHFSGDIPENDNLTSHIDPNPAVCTSLIVSKLLEHRYGLWAVAGAYGDNLHDSASQLGHQLELDNEQLDQLRRLGELLNYNGYGADLDDLHFHPADLYRSVHSFTSPFDFIDTSQDLAKLSRGYDNDMERAMAVTSLDTQGPHRVYRFPNESWARRVAGVYSNLRAREKQSLAHALIGENSDGSLRISVRAPLNDRKNADTLCLEFPSGGGRAAAAGINNLPLEMEGQFINRFQESFPNPTDIEP